MHKNKIFLSNYNFFGPSQACRALFATICFLSLNLSAMQSSQQSELELLLSKESCRLLASDRPESVQAAFAFLKESKNLAYTALVSCHALSDQALSGQYVSEPGAADSVVQNADGQEPGAAATAPEFSAQRATLERECVIALLAQQVRQEKADYVQAKLDRERYEDKLKEMKAWCVIFTKVFGGAGALKLMCGLIM